MLNERLRNEVSEWYREGMYTDSDADRFEYSAELEKYETQTGIGYDYSWDRA